MAAYGDQCECFLFGKICHAQPPLRFWIKLKRRRAGGIEVDQRGGSL